MGYIEQKIEEREAKLASSDAKIAEARRRIAAAEEVIANEQRDRVEIEAELRAYRDVLANAVLEAEPRPVESAPERKRGLSKLWKDLIGSIGLAHPNSLTLHEAYAMARIFGYDIREDSIRSQIASHVKRGLVTRRRPGEFSVSPEQLHLAGISEAEMQAIEERIDEYRQKREQSKAAGDLSVPAA